MIRVNLMSPDILAVLAARTSRRNWYYRNRDAQLKARAAYGSRPEVKQRELAYRTRPEVKTKQWERSLKRLGWTSERWAKRLKEQKNLCGICGEPFTTNRPPCADHSHEVPSRPRALLHRTCNAAIGLLKEDPNLCLMAAEYLKKWRKSV